MPALAWLALALLAPAADPLPISAHNCYPANANDRGPIERALALGIDNIEVDVGWDADRKRLLVGHDAAPRPGVTYPEFADYVAPALQAHAKAPRDDAAPTVLTVEWKTAEPDAVRAFKTLESLHDSRFPSSGRTFPSHRVAHAYIRL